MVGGGGNVHSLPSPGCWQAAFRTSCPLDVVVEPDGSIELFALLLRFFPVSVMRVMNSIVQVV